MAESVTREVLNRQQAWNVINQYIPNSRLILDNEVGKRCNCKAWKDFERHNTFVYDFKDRFEIHFSNSEIITINIKQPTTLDEYVDYEASTITIRNKNSEETTRNSTKEEKDILKKIILGTLNSIKGGNDRTVATYTAEYIAMLLFEETEEGRVNTYDSIYQKVWKCPDSLLGIK